LFIKALSPCELAEWFLPVPCCTWLFTASACAPSRQGRLLLFHWVFAALPSLRAGGYAGCLSLLTVLDMCLHRCTVLARSCCMHAVWHGCACTDWQGWYLVAWSLWQISTAAGGQKVHVLQSLPAKAHKYYCPFEFVVLCCAVLSCAFKHEGCCFQQAVYGWVFCFVTAGGLCVGVKNWRLDSKLALVGVISGCCG
jgi:hypothetical protein